jgi:hypothetical protein
MDHLLLFVTHLELGEIQVQVPENGIVKPVYPRPEKAFLLCKKFHLTRANAAELLGDPVVVWKNQFVSS